MAWTDPRTWVTGEVVTAAQMNANVRDNSTWLLHQISYVEMTSNVNVSTPTDIITTPALTFNGTEKAKVEFFSPAIVIAGTGSNGTLWLNLYEDGADIGQMAIVKNVTAAALNVPVWVVRYLTPTAASHTYKIRATQINGTHIVSAGAGGAGNLMPGFIRVSVGLE